MSSMIALSARQGEHLSPPRQGLLFPLPGEGFSLILVVSQQRGAQLSQQLFLAKIVPWTDKEIGEKTRWLQVYSYS